MRTTTEIADWIESIIPAELLARYSHLSYSEMAEIVELADWADELREAELAWFAADDYA